MMLRALIISGAILSGAPAYAGMITGNQLHDWCQREAGIDGKSIGLGYMLGVSDTLSDIFVCLPPNVTAGQVRDVVCRHVGNHPEERHKVGHGLVTEALNNAFPCKPK